MTRFGWGLLSGAVIMVAIGFIAGSSPARVLGIGGLGLSALALTYLVRPVGLQVSREVQPHRVGRDGTAVAYFDITNTGPMAVPATVAEQGFGRIDVRVVLPKLARNEQVVRTFRLPTDRRGIFELGPLEAWRSDPFRIVRRSWRYCETDELWVYPKILAFRPLPTGLARPLEGPTSDTSPQGSITFHRIREYVVGDDLRMIHWKSTARTGTLMVRHNIDTSQPYSVVVVDDRPGLFTASSFELAMDVAASAIAASAAGRAPVQLRLTSGSRIGGPSTRDPQPLFDLLTALDPTEHGDLSASLLELQHERGGTSLTIITGDVNELQLSTVGRLRRRFQRIVCIVVEDPHAGSAAPRISTPLVGVTVVTACSGEEVTAAWNEVVSR